MTNFNEIEKKFDEKFPVLQLVGPENIGWSFPSQEDKDNVLAFFRQEFEAREAELKAKIEGIVNSLSVELDLDKMQPGFERWWKKLPSGRYVENCFECENYDKIVTASEKLLALFNQ